MLLRTPKITWGAAFGNALEVEVLDNAVAYPEPRDGSETDDAPSGTRNTWITGTSQILEGDLPYIPTNTGDNVNCPIQTGWDGAAGVAAFLTWARAGNAFRWIPDRTIPGTYQTCYLLEPMNGPPTLDTDGARRLHIKIRTTDDSPFTGY